MLNEKEKTLIYYILEGFKNSLYFDDDLQDIDFSPLNISFNMDAINKLVEGDLFELKELIENIMLQMLQSLEK